MISCVLALLLKTEGRVEMKWLQVVVPIKPCLLSTSIQYSTTNATGILSPSLLAYGAHDHSLPQVVLPNPMLVIYTVLLPGSC